MVDALQHASLPAIASATRDIAAPGARQAASTPSQANNKRFRDILAAQLMSTPSPYRAAFISPTELSTELEKIPAAKLQRIDNAARQLEGLLLETLLKQMWATLPKNSLLGNGLEAKFYREMWLEELSADISSSGPGTGMAATLTWEMIERELTLADLAPSS